jgi:hypothetical protein
LCAIETFPVNNARELSGITGQITRRAFTVELAACACACLAVFINDDNTGRIDDYSAFTVINDAVTFLDSHTRSILFSDSAVWTEASFNSQTAVG